jgi:hypothetical protein
MPADLITSPPRRRGGKCGNVPTRMILGNEVLKSDTDYLTTLFNWICYKSVDWDGEIIS